MAQAANTNAVQTPNVATQAATATHFAVWDASSGGNLYFSDAATNTPAEVAIGGRYRFAAGGLVITLPVASDSKAAAAVDALTKWLATRALYVSIHTADPGPNGTTGEISALGRIPIPAGGWTIT